jgi:hypothetical protein
MYLNTSEERLAVSDASPASHRDRSRERPCPTGTRSDDGTWWRHVTEEQRRQAGCNVDRIQQNFDHGLQA